MNIILLSGGSGKRLWPLSNDIRSKQFIKIFKTADGYESMVQRVYRQIKEVDPAANVTIATSKTQVSSIHNQLGDSVGVCVEPCRRDTFPAIALASAYLHDVKGVAPQEPVVVCPVDPYVNNDYFEALHTLSQLAQHPEDRRRQFFVSRVVGVKAVGHIARLNHRHLGLEAAGGPEVQHRQGVIGRRLPDGLHIRLQRRRVRPMLEGRAVKSAAVAGGGLPRRRFR